MRNHVKAKCEMLKISNLWFRSHQCITICMRLHQKVTKRMNFLHGKPLSKIVVVKLSQETRRKIRLAEKYSVVWENYCKIRFSLTLLLPYQDSSWEPSFCSNINWKYALKSIKMIILMSKFKFSNEIYIEMWLATENSNIFTAKVRERKIKCNKHPDENSITNA